MKSKRFTDEQIHSILAELDAGADLGEVCVKYDVSRQTLKRWRDRMDAAKASAPPAPPKPEADVPQYVAPAVFTPPAPKPKPAPVPADPAAFPEGFMNRVDYLLSHRANVMASIRGDHDLWALTRTLLLISVLMAACYGFVMGATGWLQGSSWPLNQNLIMMVAVAIKVPALFLLSLLIVLFPVHVSARLLGLQASFTQVTALLLASTAVTVTALASMATVAFFFSLTTQSYHFIKLLHVAFFAYGGLVGMAMLTRGFRELAGDSLGRWRRPTFALWLVLYGFVGTQLAWVLRPFVGSPGTSFELFRERSGDFYSAVLQSLAHILGGG